MTDNGHIDKASGGCLCGEVRYEVRGPLRNVINCHCSKCRRMHGHMAAYASARRENLVLTKQDGLKWYRSVTDETPDVHRGFCQECGSSLFWDPEGLEIISPSQRVVWIQRKVLIQSAMYGCLKREIITKLLMTFQDSRSLMAVN